MMDPLWETAKLYDDFDDEITRIASDKIIAARIAMLFKFPFFGNIAIQLKIIPSDTTVETLAVNGHGIIKFNSRFINALTDQQVIFALAHEVLHVVYDVFGREGDRDSILFNYAVDYADNADLVTYNIGDMIPGVLYDKKYVDMSSEDIYDDLIKNNKKTKNGRLLDCHAKIGKDGDGEKSKSSVDPMKAAVIYAASMENAGVIPDSIKTMVHALTSPVLDWRGIIRQSIQSLVNDDYSWNRPSRKGWGSAYIMPGHSKSTAIDVAVAIDTSGSISDDMVRDMLSEVLGIMETFDDFNLRLWCFDTIVKESTYKEFTPDNINDIHEWESVGGGGTMFECNWEFMKSNGIEPKKFIMFTDMMPNGGFCPEGDENYCDTIFIAVGSSQIAPFGETVKYK